MPAPTPLAWHAKKRQLHWPKLQMMEPPLLLTCIPVVDVLSINQLKHIYIAACVYSKRIGGALANQRLWRLSACVVCLSLEKSAACRSTIYMRKSFHSSADCRTLLMQIFKAILHEVTMWHWLQNSCYQNPMASATTLDYSSLASTDRLGEPVGRRNYSLYESDEQARENNRRRVSCERLFRLIIQSRLCSTEGCTVLWRFTTEFCSMECGRWPSSTLSTAAGQQACRQRQTRETMKLMWWKK